MGVMILTFDPEGITDVDVQDGSGTKCKDMTKFLRDCGSVLSDREKDEIREPEMEIEITEDENSGQN